MHFQFNNLTGIQNFCTAYTLAMISKPKNNTNDCSHSFWKKENSQI